MTRAGVHTSKSEPSDMNSITMHILGGFVHAAMKSTTLGCLRDVITRTCHYICT